MGRQISKFKVTTDKIEIAVIDFMISHIIRFMKTFGKVTKNRKSVVIIKSSIEDILKKNIKTLRKEIDILENDANSFKKYETVVKKYNEAVKLYNEVSNQKYKVEIILTNKKNQKWIFLKKTSIEEFKDLVSMMVQIKHKSKIRTRRYKVIRITGGTKDNVDEENKDNKKRVNNYEC